MITTITVIHLLVCFILILVVLLQTGKGSEMGAVFGGSSQTVFGSGGAAPFLSKFTTGTAIVFMLTSLLLATLAAQPESSLMDDEVAAPVSAPATLPAAEPIAPVTPSETEQTVPATQAPLTKAIESEQATQPVAPIAQKQESAPTTAAPKATEETPAATH